MSESSPTDTKEHAQQIQIAWQNFDPAATFGDLTLAQLTAGMTQLLDAEMQISQLEDQLTSARNAAKTKRHELWQMVKRVKAGSKAKFGDDSDIYERFGGTRMSERKRSSKQIKDEGTPPYQP